MENCTRIPKSTKRKKEKKKERISENPDSKHNTNNYKTKPYDRTCSLVNEQATSFIIVLLSPTLG